MEFYGPIQDEVIDDIHVNDFLVFLKEWFRVYDYVLKKKMLEKSIELNKKLEELDEMELLKITAMDRSVGIKL